MRTSARFAKALRAWRAALPSSRVVVDPTVLRRYETATFATDQKVVAVLRPRTVDQVRACAAIASRHRVALYAIGTGKNWGYGCRVPVTSRCVVVDLADMNRIVDVDEQLGCVTVQPGVTFGQLAELLRRRRSAWMATCILASPDAGVLGNALERGIGVGPHPNRVEHMCALEVVTGTGERIHTGMSRFERAAARHVHRLGVGPSLDGLFSQSGFGIVTQATIWLSRRPKYVQIVSIEFSPRQMAAVVPSVQYLQASGITRVGVKLRNPYAHVIDMYRTWGRDVDPADLARPLRDDGMPWRCDFPLYAESLDRARSLERLAVRALQPVVTRLARSKIHPSSSAHVRFWVGAPQDEVLDLLYWRAKRPSGRPLDIYRDRRGVLFWAPTAPLASRHVARAVEILTRTVLAGGFEPSITVNVMNERLAQIMCAIYFDRRRDDAAALAVHARGLRKLIAAGYVPSRLGIQSMAALPRSRDDTDQVVERLRRAFDPKRILSPGRYVRSR